MNKINKILVFIIILNLTFSFTLADRKTIITGQEYLDEQSFLMDNINFTISFDKNNNGLNATTFISDYLVINVNNRECKEKDYYEFCFNEFISLRSSSKEIVIERNKAKVTIKKINCYPYVGELNITCTKQIGQLCNIKEECYSNICLHGVCSDRSFICGDGYCDNQNKICPEDCINKIEMINQTPPSFIIPVNKEKMSTNITLMPGKVYNFTVEGEYLIDKSNKRIKPEGINELNKFNPCPEENTGAIIAFLCDKCYAVSKMKSFIIDKKCQLYFQINEVILRDNTGTVQVTIIDNDNLELYQYENIKSQIKNILTRYIYLISNNKYSETFEFIDEELKELNKLRDIMAKKDIFDPQIKEILSKNYSIDSISFDEEEENYRTNFKLINEQNSKDFIKANAIINLKNEKYFIKSFNLNHQNYSIEIFKEYLSINEEEKRIELEQNLETNTNIENIKTNNDIIKDNSNEIIEEEIKEPPKKILIIVVSIVSVLIFGILLSILLSKKKNVESL
jgi:hypothetical protein